MFFAVLVSKDETQKQSDTPAMDLTRKIIGR